MATSKNTELPPGEYRSLQPGAVGVVLSLFGLAALAVVAALGVAYSLGQSEDQPSEITTPQYCDYKPCRPQVALPEESPDR
jgi:hypothetical protein